MRAAHSLVLPRKPQYLVMYPTTLVAKARCVTGDRSCSVVAPIPEVRPTTNYNVERFSSKSIVSLDILYGNDAPSRAAMAKHTTRGAVVGHDMNMPLAEADTTRWRSLEWARLYELNFCLRRNKY